MSDMKDAFRKAGYNAPPAQQGGNKPQFSQPQPAGKVVSLPGDYTVKAEQVITALPASMGRDYQNFTTSKIRNIMAMVNDIYNDVQADSGESLSSDIQEQILYMKVRLVYECGREPRVIKPFVEKAELLEIIAGIKDSRANFISFARYMEALVAYHRFLGGRD